MRNHPYGFEIYLVNVKTMRTIAQIFVVFSKKLNFIKYVSRHTVLYPEAHFVQWGSSLKRMQDLLMRTYKLLR